MELEGEKCEPSTGSSTVEGLLIEDRCKKKKSLWRKGGNRCVSRDTREQEVHSKTDGYDVRADGNINGAG